MHLSTEIHNIYDGQMVRLCTAQKLDNGFNAIFPAERWLVVVITTIAAQIVFRTS